MATRLNHVTADELLRMPSDLRCELVDGEIIEMSPAGHVHGRIASRFTALLGPFVLAHRLGECYAAETGFKISSDPDTVLAPDVSFVSASREAAAGDSEGFFPGAPDLAVEVISPSDRYSEVAAKVQRWLTAGARMVVVIDPPKKTVIVHQSRTDVLILKEGDVFDGGDVVPGWTLQVSDLFS
jgi:Uma2 family endonuclease